jgi:hypothetical protein
MFDARLTTKRGDEEHTASTRVFDKPPSSERGTEEEDLEIAAHETGELVIEPDRIVEDRGCVYRR